MYKQVSFLPLPDFQLAKIYLTRQETYALIKHTNLTLHKIHSNLVKITFFYRVKKDWVKWTSSKSCALFGTQYMLCRTGKRVLAGSNDYRLEEVHYGNQNIDGNKEAT
jgi:hypothetical protein